MNRFFVVILVISWSNGFSQFDSLGINTPWFKGSVNLSNGGTLNGFIQNNEQLGLIRYKPKLNSDDHSQVLRDQDISSMEYFDNRISSLRKYATIRYRNNFYEDTKLFEILREFKSFIVLSSRSSVSRATRVSTDVNGATMVRNLGFEQSESISVLMEDGEFKRLLYSNLLENDRENFLARKKKAKVEVKVLMECTGRYWNQVSKYIKGNDLELRIKSDLIKAIDYYGQLVSSETN